MTLKPLSRLPKAYRCSRVQLRTSSKPRCLELGLLPVAISTVSIPVSAISLPSLFLATTVKWPSGSFCTFWGQKVGYMWIPCRWYSASTCFLHSMSNPAHQGRGGGGVVSAGVRAGVRTRGGFGVRPFRSDWSHIRIGLTPGVKLRFKADAWG